MRNFRCLQAAHGQGKMRVLALKCARSESLGEMCARSQPNMSALFGKHMAVTNCVFRKLAPSSDPGLLGILGSSLPLFGIN
jgi:hypothetical protein